jgi:predicted nucleotidyltransferase
MIEIEKISRHGEDEIKLIREEAAKYKQIDSIYLFGSCSRKEDTPNSDIDTIIIWKDYENTKKEGKNIADFVMNIYKMKLFEWDRLFFNTVEEAERDAKYIFDSSILIYRREEDNAECTR